MVPIYDPPHLGELIRESIEAAERLGHAGVSAALALERIGWNDAEQAR